MNADSTVARPAAPSSRAHSTLISESTPSSANDARGPMCSGAILLFQIPRVIVGEAESFPGDLGFLTERGVDVVLLGDRGCVAVMQEFQRRYPEVWSEDIGGR